MAISLGIFPTFSDKPICNNYGIPGYSRYIPIKHGDFPLNMVIFPSVTICYPNPSRPLVSPHPIWRAARRRAARAWLACPLLAPPRDREEARRLLGAEGRRRAGASDHDRLPGNPTTTMWFRWFRYVQMLENGSYRWILIDGLFIELDDGKIETGKPNQFHGKNHGLRLRFSRKPIQWSMKSYWVSIIVGAFMRWLNPADAPAWRRMVWWSGCFFFQDILHRKKQAQMAHRKYTNQSSKKHQIPSKNMLVHLFTCSIETISSTPNHTHYTIISYPIQEWEELIGLSMTSPPSEWTTYCKQKYIPLLQIIQIWPARVGYVR